MKLRVPLRELSEGSRLLDAEASRYVARVHRLGNGDSFVVFDPDERTEADACITHVTAQSVAISVGATRPAAFVADREIRWIHALPKGDKSDAIVADATELGATTIVFVHSARTVVKLDDDRARAKVVRWEKIAREAARQCGRGDVPTIAPVTTWEDALRSATGTKVCLYEGAIERLRVSVLAEGALTFAVGSEGGLDPTEVECARSLGFGVLSLGEFILRTETVCGAVLGAVRVFGFG